MRRLLPLLFLVLSLPVHADTEAEIRTALDFFAQVWNENDIEAMQGYYHSGFMQISNEGRIDRDQHLKNVRALVDDGGDRGKLVYSDVIVQELGEDHAMASGHLALEFKDGSAIDTWFTTVYVRTPFGWKAILTRN